MSLDTIHLQEFVRGRAVYNFKSIGLDKCSCVAPGIIKLLLPPSQIISHSKNLEELKFFKFDQIYIAK